MSENLVSIEQAENDVLAAAAFLAQHLTNRDGHADAIGAIVPRYVARGEVDLAAELANSVEDPFIRDRLLIDVAEKCAEIGDEDYGLQLADAIEDIGMRSQARERMAIKKAAAGEFDKALQISEQVLHADYVHAEIVVAMEKKGDPEAAAGSMNSIELAVAKVSAYVAIAGWHLQNERPQDAVAFLKKAADVASDIEHSEEKIRSLCEIAAGFTEAGDEDSAKTVYANALEETTTLSTASRDAFLSAIAVGSLKAGDMDAADETLDLVKDKTQVASGLLGFARLLGDSGDGVDALEALEEAYSISRSERENEVRDSRSSNGVFGAIAAQFAAFGRPERGIEAAQENRDDGERMKALTAIAEISAAAGDDDIAGQALRCIEDDGNRTFALIRVSGTYAEAGAKEKALETLNESAALANDLPQLGLKISALEAIAQRFGEIGSPDKAVEICLQTLETISTIRSDSDRAASLAGLSDVYAVRGIDLTAAERERLVSIVRATTW